MNRITVAATQMACTWDHGRNIKNAERLVRQAHGAGANIILLQELFESPYFCKDEDATFFSLAKDVSANTLIETFMALAKELNVVLPISFFERAGNVYYNSVAMIDADGTMLGVYRKSHIPESPGYQEKFYFSPGDTGFMVWKTRYANLGVGICWDQWFPEAARCMALQGAELLLYPTAIGSEPSDDTLDSCNHWQRVMQGHAGANLVPVIASNRIGQEEGKSCSVTFYGSSFVTDHTGAILTEASRDKEAVVHATIDLAATREARSSWGVFRDRRPDLYRPILSLDGDRTGRTV